MQFENVLTIFIVVTIYSAYKEVNMYGIVPCEMGEPIFEESDNGNSILMYTPLNFTAIDKMYYVNKNCHLFEDSEYIDFYPKSRRDHRSYMMFKLQTDLKCYSIDDEHTFTSKFKSGMWSYRYCNFDYDGPQFSYISVLYSNMYNIVKRSIILSLYLTLAYYILSSFKADVIDKIKTT